MQQPSVRLISVYLKCLVMFFSWEQRTLHAYAASLSVHSCCFLTISSVDRTLRRPMKCWMSIVMAFGKGMLRKCANHTRSTVNVSEYHSVDIYLMTCAPLLSRVPRNRALWKLKYFLKTRLPYKQQVRWQRLIIH